jgi:hypothetical protein
MLNNAAIAWIRTVVPLAVGYLLTLVAEHFNIVVSESSTVSLTGLAVAVVTAAYYSLVRLLEHYMPQLGVLLGVPARPNYRVIEGQAVSVLDQMVTGGPDPTEPAPIVGPITATQASALTAAEAAPITEGA